MPLPFQAPGRKSSQHQRYTPLHESIPEEVQNDRRYSDTFTLSDLDDDDNNDDNDDDSHVKLRRVDHARNHSHSAAYAPAPAPDRRSTDVETYLDSITEAEQELLSAARQYELTDESDEEDYNVKKMGHRRRPSSFRRHKPHTGWRAYYYSRWLWWTLVVIFAALGLMVWGFLDRAWLGDPDRLEMTPAESWFPTPKGGALEDWAEDYRKAEMMVRDMTLIEKINITTGIGWQMGLCVGNTGSAELVKFPSLCLQDGPLGLRYADLISAFPAGITTGATWNRDLIRKRGEALGEEARIKGVNVLLGPSMGAIGMMPAGGRNWESFGSDPVLQGVAAAETIRGIQSRGVMATAKHFVLNEQEHFRQPLEWGIPSAMSSNVGDRALHEVFVWPFAESIRADVASVMCSYQMVNNSHACENSKLLNGILKDELGFQGFVQSDWLAQRSGINSALGGLDMSMPGDGLYWADGRSLWGSELTRAVLNTSVPMDRLNDMVTRIVASWYHLGQDHWERPPPEGDGGPNFSSWTNDQVGWLHQGSPDDEAYGIVNKLIDAQGEGADAHWAIARQVAAEGIVLVKNDKNTLPLSRRPNTSGGVYRVGIYGDDAGPAQGPNACPDRGCNQGTLAMGWGSGTVEMPYLVSPIEALQSAWVSEVEVHPYLRNAVMPADAADKNLCLVFANADSGEGYISAGGIHGDRNHLFLQKGGDSLIQTVASSCGGPTVVVVHAVGPVVVESWIDIPGVEAVLFAHLPGQESGHALMDVLFGEVDASGRLPYTVGKSLADYGPAAQVLYEPNAAVPQVDFSDGLYIDHRYFDRHNITPRFEFGYGLSYTTFELAELRISGLQPKSQLPASRPGQTVYPPEYDLEPPRNESVFFPAGFQVVSKYIYPYLPSEQGTAAANYTHYPKGYNQVQPPSEAGGGLGGNPSLYEEMAQVEVQVRNTGSREGQTVVQVYVSFPDEVTEDGDWVEVHQSSKVKLERMPEMIDFPVRVLRNFSKVALGAGEEQTVSMSLSRKDLSYWSVRQQNWVMPQGDFEIWVGSSSRDLPLRGYF
ncbi:beta-glucosidase E [Aspergillus ellipticus CBS 707.79]|uniref:Probable beta-glucosidase E n=1 Tax=Aspergillus ellipticus CBS 707.79 TaxID=1448320 RepID=A0A319D9X1_9EURO|nr:beta-glucosidase E [Aspergillus ellipticus CBS 707.79]